MCLHNEIIINKRKEERNMAEINLRELGELSTCEKMCLSVIVDTSDCVLDLNTITETVNKKFNKNWKIQTVATYLTRMVNKGYIDNSVRIGRYTQFRSVLTKEELLQYEINNLNLLYGYKSFE
jgi:predicted transcriptional regulator